MNPQQHGDDPVRNGMYEAMNHEDPPFEKHRRYYLIIKIAVIIVAGLLALRYFG